MGNIETCFDVVDLENVSSLIARLEPFILSNLIYTSILERKHVFNIKFVLIAKKTSTWKLGLRLSPSLVQAWSQIMHA